MTLPCLLAARRFARSRHLPFTIGGTRVGWLRAADARLLAAWPDVFDVAPDRVALTDRLQTPAARSAALGTVIDALAADGSITGWRNETYAIRNAFDDAPLAFIERAAARFFGTMTYAVHANGVVVDGGAAPRFWIARRSATKTTDPGMLDTLVGGGIGWGYGIGETLVKESWEESGVPPERVRDVLCDRGCAGGSFHVRQEIAEGTQDERLFTFDLVLPADFVPANQDGEVAEHRLADAGELMHWIAAGAMTVDASLTSLDCLLRRGLIDAADCAGLAALAVTPDDD